MAQSQELFRLTLALCVGKWTTKSHYGRPERPTAAVSQLTSPRRACASVFLPKVSTRRSERERGAIAISLTFLSLSLSLSFPLATTAITEPSSSSHSSAGAPHEACTGETEKGQRHDKTFIHLTVGWILLSLTPGLSLALSPTLPVPLSIPYLSASPSLVCPPVARFRFYRAVDTHRLTFSHRLEIALHSPLLSSPFFYLIHAHTYTQGCCICPADASPLLFPF